MPIRLVAASDGLPAGPQRGLAALAEAFLPALETHPAIQAYDLPERDIEITVHFGGKRECRVWGVRQDCMGFHAVCSPLRTDRRTGDRYREVAETHVVFVNMVSAEAELGRWWDRNQPDDRAADLEAWLVTVPHEVLHALEWIKETGGKAPMEVYDRADLGVEAIAAVSLAIRDRLARGRPGGDEHYIESLAREVTASILPEAVAEMAERTWAALAGDAPPPPAPPGP